MKTLTRTFLAITAFAAIVATVYWFVSDSEAEGRVLFIVWAVMTATIAGYAIAHGALRDRQAGPADDPSATPQDLAGRRVGGFPFSSTWPIVFVLGVVVAGASMIYGLLLLPVGVVVIAIAVLGLMRESRA